MIRPNVGGIDRVLRVVIGGIFFLGGLILLTGRTTLGVTLSVVGSLALLTGIVRFCALYIPFGISTARPERQPISQVCHCAAQMKVMQNDRALVGPPDIAEEEVRAGRLFAARVDEPLAVIAVTDFRRLPSVK